MKLVLAISLALALLAGAAQAQTKSATVPTKPAGDTVSGVVVEGRKTPSKACSAKDDACVLAVVAELKAHYPEQLQRWCDHVQERAAMNDLMFDRGPDASTDGHPHPNVVPYLPPPVDKVACVSDKPRGKWQ